jgi:hypothetical protein
VLPAETILIWDSEGLGDHVGRGGSGTVTDADGVWVALSQQSTFRDATLRLDDEGEFSSLWRLYFGAASGDQLVPGLYPDATGNDFQSEPFVDVSFDGRTRGS